MPVYLVPMADVQSLVTNSLPGVKQLLRALAESAFKVSEAECAVKQQVGEETIQRLEQKLVESRQRIETQALEAAAVATQLDSAIQQVAKSSVLRKDKLDEAVVSQFPTLFKAHLQKIKAGGDFTKVLSGEEVLELKHARGRHGDEHIITFFEGARVTRAARERKNGRRRQSGRVVAADKVDPQPHSRM